MQGSKLKQYKIFTWVVSSLRAQRAATWACYWICQACAGWPAGWYRAVCVEASCRSGTTRSGASVETVEALERAHLLLPGNVEKEHYLNFLILESSSYNLMSVSHKDSINDPRAGNWSDLCVVIPQFYGRMCYLHFLNFLVIVTMIRLIYNPEPCIWVSIDRI